MRLTISVSADINNERKGMRSDSVLCQKPLYQQKIPPINDNTKRHQENSITQGLQTELGLSVGETTIIELVLINWFTGTQPSHFPQKLGS